MSSRTIERIERNIAPLPKDRIAACSRLVDDPCLPDKIRRLAELVVDPAGRVNLILGALKFGCAINTDDVSENRASDDKPRLSR